jgi:probable rRNA maturation factor
MKKIIVEFYNKEKSPLRKPFLYKIAKIVFEETGLLQCDNDKISISFANVSEGEIRKLNASYRKINKVTDVLSFSEPKRTKHSDALVTKNLFLGEVVLCYNNIVKYAKRYKLDIWEELSEVTAHGVLHLLGYKHGQKMFGIQKKIKNYEKTRKLKM